MQLIILSDVHGNLSAFKAVMADIQKKYRPDGMALLGDFIDYGMRSNEVIDAVKKISYPIVCNLWGNHEQSVMLEDYSRFSSSRGVQSARYTRSRLSESSFAYIESIAGKSGFQDFDFAGIRFLAVHGSILDPFWKAISPIAGNGMDGAFAGYEKYDVVLSGHSHYSHIFPVFYEADDASMGNKKKTVFINPGSVGQPRNHNPMAQYALLDTERGISLNCVPYDIAEEQKYFTDEVDEFYKDRLAKGV